MKHVYPKTLVLLVFIAATISQTVLGQCACSGGIPATQLNYTYTLPPTQAGISTIPFPKFDPSIGNLNCVEFSDTISGVSVTGVRNLDPTAKREYTFALTVGNAISGPGLSVIQPFNKIYGPDSLSKFGDPGDSITYGPDTVFNNATRSSFSGMVAPYIGLGTVNLTYTINGGLLSLEGGLNYHDQIVTNYWGNFGLTYFWCPANPLAASISNFSAVDKGDFVQLQWLAPNEGNNLNYEIQYSLDGSAFHPLGNEAGNEASDGNLSTYRFQYPLNHGQKGTLYFRIRRIDADGASSYSMIKVVNLDAGASIGVQTYPNPVVNSVTLQFDENQTGNFLLSLVSLTGQIIQQKQVSLNGNNLLTLDIRQRPAKGLYFLRAVEQSGNKQFVAKVLIE